MRLKWCSHKGQSAHWELHRLSRKPFWQVQSQPRLAFPNQWVRAIWRSVGEKGWTRVVQRSVGEYRVPGKYVAVCVCVNTPRNTGKWFLIGTFSGQCHKSKPSDGADFEVFRSSLFWFFNYDMSVLQISHLRLFRFLTYLFPTNFKQGALGPTSKPEPTKTLEVWMCKRTCSFLTWPAAKPRTALPITTFTTFNFRLMDEPFRLYWNSTSTNYKEWLRRTNFFFKVNVLKEAYEMQFHFLALHQTNM